MLVLPRKKNSTPINMPLSEDNQQWVLDQIQQTRYPNGWRKIADRLRYWGLLGVIVTAILGLIAIVVTLGIFATNKISQESEFRGKADQRLKDIESTLQDLKAVVASIHLAQVSSTPTNPQSSKEAQTLLDAAKAKNIRLSNDAIVEAGKRFVEASTTNADAWNAVLKLLDYKSLNNGFSSLLPDTTNVPEFRDKYEINIINGEAPRNFH